MTTTTRKLTAEEAETLETADERMYTDENKNRYLSEKKNWRNIHGKTERRKIKQKVRKHKKIYYSSTSYLLISRNKMATGYRCLKFIIYESSRK